MQPTLQSGRVVLIRRWARPKTGIVVVIRHNGLEKIKRIQDIQDSQVFVVGDNPSQSTDSRQFGWLPVSHVQGRVVGRRLNRAMQKTK